MSERGEWMDVPGLSDEGFREAMEGRHLLELGDGRVGCVIEVDYDAQRICVDWIKETAPA